MGIVKAVEIAGKGDQVTIQAGGQRPYYITAKGKENGTYIRVSGTTRPADPFVLKELEFEGSNRCFDQTYAAPNAAVSDEQIDELCEKCTGIP